MTTERYYSGLKLDQFNLCMQVVLTAIDGECVQRRFLGLQNVEIHCWILIRSSSIVLPRRVMNCTTQNQHIKARIQIIVNTIVRSPAVIHHQSQGDQPAGDEQAELPWQRKDWESKTWNETERLATRPCTNDNYWTNFHQLRVNINRNTYRCFLLVDNRNRRKYYSA